MVKKVIGDKEFAAWRFDLKLYSKLGLFRTIVLKIEPCIWWDITKMFRPMKKVCCTMLRLLCGCSCLRLHKEHTIIKSERVCLQCNDNSIEDVKHFVIYCNVYNVIRHELFQCIDMSVTFESREVFQSLSEVMMFNIIMGMDYPISDQDLLAIRYISAYYIHNMYKQRFTSN